MAAAVDAIRPAADRKQVTLRLEECADPDRIRSRADPELLRRAVRALATATQVLSGAFFCAAIYLLTSFVRNAQSRLEVLAEGDAVTVRERGLFRTRETKLPADDIVGVIVAKDEDGVRSVVIAGPRHTALLDVHRAKLLDPDSLSVWIADGVGIVARKASARPARPCGRLQKQSLARQAGSAS